jgi:hypothetical protein
MHAIRPSFVEVDKIFWSFCQSSQGRGPTLWYSHRYTLGFRLLGPKRILACQFEKKISSILPPSMLAPTWMAGELRGKKFLRKNAGPMSRPSVQPWRDDWICHGHRKIMNKFSWGAIIVLVLAIAFHLVFNVAQSQWLSTIRYFRALIAVSSRPDPLCTSWSGNRNHSARFSKIFVWWCLSSMIFFFCTHPRNMCSACQRAMRDTNSRRKLSAWFSTAKIMAMLENNHLIHRVRWDYGQALPTTTKLTHVPQLTAGADHSSRGLACGDSLQCGLVSVHVLPRILHVLLWVFHTYRHKHTYTWSVMIRFHVV